MIAQVGEPGELSASTRTTYPSMPSIPAENESESISSLQSREGARIARSEVIEEWMLTLCRTLRSTNLMICLVESIGARSWGGAISLFTR